MSLDRKELFEKLLEQLQWPQASELPYFQGAKIDRLEVHKQSQRWQFDISIPKILPFEVFNDFNARLHSAFQDIATVSFDISVENDTFTEQLLRQYWQWAVPNSGVTSPLLKELCADKYPSIVDSRVEFVAENDIVKDFMTNTALGPIEEMYQRPDSLILLFIQSLMKAHPSRISRRLKRKMKLRMLSWSKRPTKPFRKMQKPIPSAPVEMVVRPPLAEKLKMICPLPKWKTLLKRNAQWSFPGLYSIKKFVLCVRDGSY